MSDYVFIYFKKKRRPFTNYLDLVGTIVAGGTYMAEKIYISHSPFTYLSSVANFVTQKITTYLKTLIKQTVFPPLKYSYPCKCRLA